MPSRKQRSAAVVSLPQPAAAARRKAPAARKGNSHTDFTREELEHMVLEAAYQRAEKARWR